MRTVYWCLLYSFIVAAGALTMPMSNVNAADHLDSPSVSSDGRLDINDVYAYQSPANANNVVLVMTVNPLAGVLSGTAFSSAGVYEIHVDNNGDAVADRSFFIYFTALSRGTQNVLVTRKNGSILASGKTEQNITTAAGCRLRAGLFDDPFFFDLNGFKNNFMFTGTDFFAGMNVTAIVLEIPRTELGGTNVGVWARTVVGGKQFDRMGRPAINTALIPSAQKNAFNAGVPKDDPATFGATVRASIASLNGGDTATAATLASILLPDILTVDVTSTAGFLNGRQLANDVIDAELSLLTKGAVTTDGVNGNDVAYRTTFPYLAVPHVN